jgi:hypothetical protein
MNAVVVMAFILTKLYVCAKVVLKTAVIAWEGHVSHVFSDPVWIPMEFVYFRMVMA